MNAILGAVVAVVAAAVTVACGLETSGQDKGPGASPIWGAGGGDVGDVDDPPSGADGGPPKADAGRSDAGGGGRDGGGEGGRSCGPWPVRSFTPPAYKPSLGAHLNRCTAAQIDDFYRACLDDSAPAGSCRSLFGDNAPSTARSCASCLLTKQGDPAWGALINEGDTMAVNLAGCVLAHDPSQSPCARALQAESACEAKACGVACPVVIASDFAARMACNAAAAAGDCKPFDADGACAALDGGAIAPCFAQTTFEASFRVAAAAICGP